MCSNYECYFKKEEQITTWISWSVQCCPDLCGTALRCTALQLRDHVAFLLSRYIWLPQLWRANCGRLKKPNSSIVEETWGHLLYSFMGLKQDKCETHISSHMSLLLSDLQGWRTAALQQPPPPRAVICHKSLSPWLITQALHHGTPLSSLRMLDGGTLAERTRAKPRELWRTQGCRKWSVAHAEDRHYMLYWLGLDVVAFDPADRCLETPLAELAELAEVSFE